MSLVGTERMRRRDSDAAAHAYARRYGDALRVADSAAAGRVVDDALAAGLSGSAVQSLVIAPALVRIGELWAVNAATVADEHLATAISQGVMVKLFERLCVARPRSRERVMLAAVEGQHHTVGLRMVADVLEGAGFNVLYLGGDVPVDALSQFAAKHQPAVTGLAFSVGVGVGVLADSIHAICEACPTTRIMLGGRAVPPGLVEAGYPLVDSSMEAVLTVERLLREPSRPVPKVVELLRPTHRRPRTVGKPISCPTTSPHASPRSPRRPQSRPASMCAAPVRSRISRSGIRSPTSGTGEPSTIGSSSSPSNRQRGRRAAS